MGNLVWHDLGRLVSIAASTCVVWASFWGLLFRKFFWDIIGGILRNPGGIQPSPMVVHTFVTVIVKVPVVQITSMILGLFMIAIEFPLPIIKGTPVHRSIPLRAVLLILQSSLAILFYQGTNVSIWSLIAAAFYIRALALGEHIEAPNADKPGSTSRV